MEIPAQRQPLRIILYFLLLLAATEFIMRGPVRFLGWTAEWNDFSQNYTASKLWLQGQSPCDPKNFVALWKEQVGSRLDVTDPRTHLAPPLGELVLLAPISAFPWKIAKILWLVLLLVSFAATVWALLEVAGFRRGDLRTQAFVIACLALAPFQTGIASGNLTISVVGLCALAIWAEHRGGDIAAGILFGIACSLKPQLGAFLVLFYLLRGRWRLFSTAVATTLGLILVAVIYLWLRGTAWTQDFLNNAKGFVSANNNIDDFSSVNPGRFNLINLQVPAFSITGHASSANLLAFAISFCLISAWLFWAIKGRQRVPELLSLGAIAIIGLMPVYHRFYDASLLAVPLCWCVVACAEKFKVIARAALLLMIPFLAPGSAFLQKLVATGRIPESVKDSWWWNQLVMPHETWALLALCLLLLYWMKMEASAAPSQASV